MTDQTITKEGQKKLETLLKKVVNYKPNQAPKKPSKQPNKAELEQVFIYKDGVVGVLKDKK